MDVSLLSEISLYSSSFNVPWSSSFDSSGTIPDLTSIKQRDGYKTHHQFCPSELPNFIFNAS